MEFQVSPLFEEYDAIQKSGPKPVRFDYSATIHFPDNLPDYEVVKVTTIDNVRDYQKNISDELVVEAYIPLGVYAKIIYPNRYKLDMTINRIHIGEVNPLEVKSLQAEEERYKAVLVLEGLPLIEGTEIDKMSKETLDIANVIKISFQLFNRSLEKLRLVSIGAVLRDQTNEDIIKAFLANESAKIKVQGQTPILRIDMVPADNKEKRAHTVIEQGTKLLQLPSYLQLKNGGVYSADIGTYLQDRIWYVYPLYNVTRLSKVTKCLTIVKVPSNFTQGTERTYRVENDAIFIVATSKSGFKDDGGTEFMNEGNGIRFADASKFLNSPIDTVDNKAIFHNKSLNYGFMSHNNPDGHNNIQISSNPINTNPFVEYSKLSIRGGGIFQFTWENSKPSLLQPGMMATIKYLDNDGRLREKHGVLLYAHTFIESKEPGMIKGRYITLTHMALYVNKPNPTR